MHEPLALDTVAAGLVDPWSAKPSLHAAGPSK